jgi:hypothetical protein
MTRKRKVSKAVIDQVIGNLGRTSVIGVAISSYDHLPSLVGTAKDIDVIKNIFVSNKGTSLFDESETNFYLNVNSDQFRNIFTDYALSRSARGDILILYFSGHGGVLSNQFEFCLSDSALGYEGNGLLPTTTVSFRDILHTLTSFDIHPVFIIDACFSGMTAPSGYKTITSIMDTQIENAMANSYALLASSSPYSSSTGTFEGGGFTQTLNSILVKGLDKDPDRHFPFITLDQIASPLQDELTKLGSPLSKCYVGADLPNVAISKNVSFKPDTINLSPYMVKIVEFLWNDGDPIKAKRADLLQNVGPGAYGNHSKLSLPPWNLLKDAKEKGYRQLTERGIKFASGKIKLPRTIIRDPLSWEWLAAPWAEKVSFNDYIE